jgi:hypothetical protein
MTMSLAQSIVTETAKLQQRQREAYENGDIAEEQFHVLEAINAMYALLGTRLAQNPQADLDAVFKSMGESNG